MNCSFFINPEYFYIRLNYFQYGNSWSQVGKCHKTAFLLNLSPTNGQPQDSQILRHLHDNRTFFLPEYKQTTDFFLNTNKQKSIANISRKMMLQYQKYNRIYEMLSIQFNVLMIMFTDDLVWWWSSYIWWWYDDFPGGWVTPVKIRSSPHHPHSRVSGDLGYRDNKMMGFMRKSWMILRLNMTDIWSSEPMTSTRLSWGEYLSY